jgi:hypothetical protein
MSQAPPEDKNPALRPLAFGALLDETINVFRRFWLSFVVLSAVALIPSGILLGLTQLVGPAAVLNSGSSFPAARSLGPAFFVAAAGVTMLAAIVNSLVTLLWAEAVAFKTHAVVVGAPANLGSAYQRAFTRFLPAVGAGLLIFLGALGLSLLSVILFVVTLGPLGMLADLAMLWVWWANPRARRPWLKWLIIACAPFGVATYYIVRWVLFTPAVVLEGRGALESLHRSASLVSGQWFRVLGVLIVVGIIVSVLVLLPSALVSVALALAVGNLFGSPLGAAVSNLGSVAGQVLFGALAYIAYTLLFLDLRNRREGADLAARVERLEQRGAVA